MSRENWRWSMAVLMALGVLAGPGTASADPPARVARLNYLKGSVSFRPASVDDWSEAVLNYPLTTGDHLWTEAEAWAELHVGSTALRMAPRTAVAFLDLSDRTVQVRLSEGALDVRVRRLDGGDGVEIDTPAAAIAVTRPGIYRIDVLPDGGNTRVIVRSGNVQVSSDGPSVLVSDGQAAVVEGGDGAHQMAQVEPPDAWERWCRARDEREDRAVSPQYVSSELTGYEDLDDWGTWATTPEYGWVWRPRVVVAGWAPYRYGRWRWVAPWGWTWVDEAAWGFAPFHYGRWAWFGGVWVWVPGAYVPRPIYAPALVAFVGGSGWGLSFTVGAGAGPAAPIGWFPLAPGEPWLPHYATSRTYIRSLNVANVNAANLNLAAYNVRQAHYANRAIAGAVTAMSREAFVSSQAGSRASYAVDRRVALTGDVLGSSAPLPPGADSALAGRLTARRPSAAVLARPVVVRSAPPSAQAGVRLAGTRKAGRGGDGTAAAVSPDAPPPAATATQSASHPNGVATKSPAPPAKRDAAHAAPPAHHAPPPPSAKAVVRDHKKGGR